MNTLVQALEALEKPLLVLLGVVAGGFMGPITDRLRARTAAGWWEAQERWRFKAQLYTKALATLKGMRQLLEVAATKGVWPDATTWGNLESKSRDLIEPAVVGRIWLPAESIQLLETQGDRIAELALKRDTMTDKEVLMALCELIETDIQALQRTAQRDLKLRLEP